MKKLIKMHKQMAGGALGLEYVLLCCLVGAVYTNLDPAIIAGFLQDQLESCHTGNCSTYDLAPGGNGGIGRGGGAGDVNPIRDVIIPRVPFPGGGQP